MALTRSKPDHITTFLKHGCNLVLVGSLAGLGAYFLTGRRRPRGRYVASGMAVWAVSEYLVHRFLFHGRPAERPWVRYLQRRLHYDHHRHPHELDLLFLPLWFGVPNAMLFTQVYLKATRDQEKAMSILAGTLGSMLYYEWVHYMAHIPLTPSTAWGRWMKKYHLLHHYKNEHYWFGVTTPVVDVPFGTYRNAIEVSRSTTTHDLEGDYVEPDRING
ncbi:MAG TPA: sterol desaturase family protein [Candidatus Xenobia bacterium]|jgi:hypothetical protein